MDRKAFKFYRSYWEIANQLNDSDRLKFYDALLVRQFTGVETELDGMAKFAYISQRHSIDLQIDGYLAKTQKSIPTQDPTQGGVKGALKGASIEEKEKEKEKGIIITQKTQSVKFDEFWRLFDKKVDRKKCFDYWGKIKSEKHEVILQAANAYREATPNPKFRKNPLTWLRGECWNDEIIINQSIQTNEQQKQLSAGIREQFPDI
jgi:hypothetical protein